jgi:OmpA-OmpF porin, OOP family
MPNTDMTHAMSPMKSFTAWRLARCLVGAVLLAAGSSFAQTSDLAGSADHPVLKRFTGSVITGFAAEDWTQVRLPGSTKLDKGGKGLESLQTFEGKSTRINYLGPTGKAPLEVFRNYQDALKKAGLQVRVLCQEACEPLSSAWQYGPQKLKPLEGMRWASGSLAGSGIGHHDALRNGDANMIVGSLRNPISGGSVELLLVVSSASNGDRMLPVVFVHVIEPKAMITSQVSVDASALGQGLKDDGKVALPGLFFDTGKTELRADSKAQLDEMIKLLRAQASAKVFIVGHTDNVGAFEANQALSLARAQAVVAALAAAGVDAKRLSAKGAANIAPVASNASEAGRARNRRVEMVLQ